ncbi:MAG TPA: aspartate aminotransferase family protein [Bacteroidales bacterium]|nr:aspartate aminotransferase family protein [Bacteroidales bacterium]
MLTNRQLFLLHLGQTSVAPMMVEIVRADGVFMYGPNGEKYLDLISGVSVSNTGHSHPKVIEAVKNQVDMYMHLMVYGEIIQSPQVKYAERLLQILPPQLHSCYFVNSGSEAVEGALKLAKRYTRKSRIISFNNSYHGSTHGALSIQGSELYRNAFRPLLPDTFQIDFNDEKSLNSIDNKTACVIVEPVQGEAGVIYPENGFLGKIKERCERTGALLIFDEIQTGFGRIGSMFAIDRFSIVPDILLLAKALGGGMPLGAFISSNEIMSSLSSNPPLGHITTFGGHPVCCAAGLASLNVIIEEDLVESCNSKSKLFKKELVHPLISEVRGEGLLLAVQLTVSEYIRFIIARAPDYGLILDYFLFCNDAFRIAPPLIISEDEILQACMQLKKLLDEAMNNGGKI